MLGSRLSVRLAFALTAFSALGCDGGDDTTDPDDGQKDGSSTVTADGGRKDTSSDIDAGRIVGPGDGGSKGDSAVDAGNTTDAANFDIDASGGDAAAGDAASGDAAKVDAGDASDAGDAAIKDAGDAATGDSGRADGGSCQVNSARFGCGTRVGADWIHFESGLDLDLKYGRAWSPVVEVTNPAALGAYCSGLSLGGFTIFEVPQMDDVRTLGAGCATTLPAGDCDVQAGQMGPSAGADCSCNTGTGPNNGRFCRTDVADCETLWTQTYCGAQQSECVSTPRTWFYDVRTGSVVLSAATDPIARQAKGRCVQGYNGPTP